MPIASARRVVLDLDPGPGPITGAAEDAAGVRRSFVGWLELCALLDAARATAAGPSNR